MRRVLILMVASLAVSALAQGPGVSGNAKVRRATASAASPYWTDPNVAYLVARYDFEGTAWTNDFTGTNNMAAVGVPYQCVVGTNSQGRVEDGVYLDGTNDYLTCTSSSSLTPSGAMTIAFWVRLRVGGTFCCYLGKWGVNTQSYAVYNYTTAGQNYVLFAVDNSGNGVTRRDVATTQGIPLNQWIHVVCTFTPSTTVHLYTNGIDAATQMPDANVSSVTSVYSGNAPLRIGQWGPSVADIPVPGEMDSVKLYAVDIGGTAATNLYLQDGGANGPGGNLENR